MGSSSHFERNLESRMKPSPAENGTAYDKLLSLAGPEHYLERTAAQLVGFLRGSAASRSP
jgi:hypothetical protein